MADSVSVTGVRVQLGGISYLHSIRVASLKIGHLLVYTT